MCRPIIDISVSFNFFVYFFILFYTSLFTGNGSSEKKEKKYTKNRLFKKISIASILRRIKMMIKLRLKDNQTALHIASRVGDVDMVELLISRGASMSVITADRYTPLHIAAKEGHDDVASLLLDHGVTSSPITKARLLSILNKVKLHLINR